MVGRLQILYFDSLKLSLKVYFVVAVFLFCTFN